MQKGNMENDYPENRIEDMKQDLYKRNYKPAETDIRPDLSPTSAHVPKEWEGSNETDLKDNLDERTPMTFFKKFFVLSIIFFVIALSVSAVLFFNGGNIVSSDNVDIEIVGPVSLEGGAEASFQIIVTNNNNTPLELSDIVVRYPGGTHDPNNTSAELKRERISLGTITPGESVNSIVRAIMFGEEGSEKEVGVSLEYRIEGSNAIFVKDDRYQLRISSSPVHVSIDLPKDITSGQEMEAVVKIVSNSDSVIEDGMLRVDYPFGFEPVSTNPKPAYDDNIWNLGDIGPGSEMSVRIIGVMRGTDDEEKIFNVHMGKRDPENERQIATIYNSAFGSTFLQKPFLGVRLTLGGESSDEYIANSGEAIKGVLLWTNNAQTRIVDAVIELKFEGEALNKFTVAVDRGFYNSSTNTVVWDKSVLPELSSLDAGATGRMNFSFASKSLLATDAGYLRDPNITLTISVAGKRLSGSGFPEEISEFIQKNVKINSEMRLSAQMFYQSGPFANSGPLPPKVDQETTYTINWSVVNSSNSLSDVKVSAMLPSYVHWRSTTFPGNEDISFNEQTGEVIWRVGSLDAGIGVAGKTKEVSFQIGLIPSLTQIGKIPEVVSGITLSATDDFTHAVLERSYASLTTNLKTEPAFNSAQGRVGI